MADINALYSSLLAADEARDAAALTAVAWQVYGELATTAADLGALRARFRVYAAAAHASGRSLPPRGGQTGACGGRVAGRRPPGEMSVQMRKLTAAASASLGTVEPPAQGARPSGNGQRQIFAASQREGSGASQPSAMGGPNESHGCWPRQDNDRLPAAGLAALLTVASLGPDLPCRNDPELFFAESPDDVRRAKALCRECPARTACLAGALKRREPWGVWGGELFLHGAIMPRKRPRGRPRKTDVAA